jgi:hypothetical protein
MSNIIINPYNYVDPLPVISWSQTTSNDHVQVSQSPSTENQKLGQTITNSSLIVGTELVKITFRLRNPFSSALTYRIYCRVWDSSGVIRTTSETVVNLNDLQTGSGWADPADRVTFEFASPVVFAQDDIVGIEPDGGTFNASSIIMRANNSSVVANTNMLDYRSGSWRPASMTSWDSWLIAYEPA